MPSESEIQFIIRMRDEAAAVIRRHEEALGRAGKGARGFGDDTRKAGLALDDLARKAKAATSAIAGVWSSNRLAQRGLRDFTGYEDGMVGVAKTTNMAGQEMQEFQKHFDRMAMSTNGVSVGGLLQIAETAGQLGIQGSRNILAFSDTMKDLEVATDVIGADGAKAIARYLTITGEGIEKVREFGDVLVYLGNNTAASEREILNQASAIAQATAQFKLGAVNIAGYAAAAAALDFRPELFGTAMGRTIRELTKAAAEGGQAMDSLTQITGMTQEEFRRLTAEDPSQAFYTFLEVIQALNNNGVELSGFLRQFNLQGEESIKVLGTAAVKLDEVRKGLTNAQQSFGSNAAAEEAAQAAQTLTAQWVGLQNTISIVMKDVLASIETPLKFLVQTARALIGGIGFAFQALPDDVKPWIATLALVSPALIGIAGALRLVGAAQLLAFGSGPIASFLGRIAQGALVLAGWLNPLKLVQIGVRALMLAFGGVAGVLRTLAVLFVSTFGLIPTLIAAGVAAIAGIAVALYRNWDSVKAFFSQSWSEIGAQLVDRIVAAFNTAIAKAKSLWEEFWKWMAGETISQRAAAANQGIGDLARAAGIDAMEEAARRPASTEETPGNRFETSAANYRQLDERYQWVMDMVTEMRKAASEAEDLEKAIAAIREMPDTPSKPTGSEIARLQAELELRKRQLDPVMDRLRMLDQEIAQASAVTAEQRNQLEVLQEIRDLQDQIGTLTAEEEQNIRAKVKALQEARKAAAYDDLVRGLREQLASAQAVTQAEKNRLEVLKTINDHERENSALKSGQRREVEALLAATQQANAFAGLRSSLDPIGSAVEKYREDLAVLKAELDGGRLSPDRYAAMARQLETQTLSSRDPFAAQMKSLREEQQLLQVSGEYRDADRQTLQAIIRLTEQGVQLTAQQKDELAAANRELQDMKKAQESGVQGWMNGVGTLRDNMMDLTKDFASGLSGAISGALQGQQGAFTNFLRNISARMIDIGVNQMLKNMLAGVQGSPSGMGGFFSKFLGTSRETPAVPAVSDTTGTVQNALQSLTTGTMTVTAATVMINGTPLTPASTGLTGSLNTDGWSLRGAIDGANDNITKAAGVMQAAGAANDNIVTMVDDAARRAAGSARGAFSDLAPQIQADLMRDLKLSREQAAGILGNLGGETGGFRHMQELNPLVKGSRGGFGWAQWTGPRRRQFEAWSQQQDLPLDSYAANYGFLKHELNTSEKGALAHLRQQTSVEGSTMSFLNRFERAGIPHSQARVNWANRAYAMGPSSETMLAGAPAGLDTMATGSIPQVQQLATQWQQQMATANTSIAQQMPQAFSQPMQNVGQQFSQVFASGNTALQQVGPQFQQIAQQAQGVVPALGGFGQQLTGLMGPLMQAPAATGQFGQALMQLIQQMGSGMGGGFGGVFGLLGGLFHKGGEVGAGAPASGFRALPAAAWAKAPRFHKGLKNDEYTAILKRGERVLTANDNTRNLDLIEGLTARLEAQQRATSRNDRTRFGNSSFNQNITVYADDANSFRKSEGQLMADSSLRMRRFASRNS